MSSVPPVAHDRAMAGVPKDANYTNQVVGNAAINKLAAKRIVSSAVESDTHSAVTSTIGTAAITDATITDATITDATITNLTVTNLTPTYPVLTLLAASIPNSPGDISGSVGSPGTVDFFLALPAATALYNTQADNANALIVQFPFAIESLTLVAAGGPKHWLTASLFADIESTWTELPGAFATSIPVDLNDVTTYSCVTYNLTTALPAYVPVKIHIGGTVTQDWDQNDCVHMQFIANLIPAPIVT